MNAPKLIESTSRFGIRLAVPLIGMLGLALFDPSQEVKAAETMLLVANKHDDTLCFIRPTTLEIVQTIATGPNPHEIIITPDQRFAYLSNYAPPGNTISLIDLVQRKHVLQIPTGKYTRIHGAAVVPDGNAAYFTAGQSGFVVEVDTGTNQVTRGIPTHGQISHMVLVSRDGKRLYTANIVSENVSVIDRASGNLVTQVPCGRGVEGIAFSPDGEHLWAANQTGGSITIANFPMKCLIEEGGLDHAVTSAFQQMYRDARDQLNSLTFSYHDVPTVALLRSWVFGTSKNYEVAQQSCNTNSSQIPQIPAF
ncbi:MAG: YncE family protein [Rhodopirellula sp.]|nr:YncE family protein [Rhodopirellula sp.]